MTVPSSDKAEALAGIHDRIGADIQGFGGFLRCETCRYQQDLGSVGLMLRHGWPKCCGHTMRWWTQRQVNAGEVPW